MGATTNARKPRTVKVSDVVNEAQTVSSAADVKPGTGKAEDAAAGSVAERDVRLAKLAKPYLRTIGSAVKDLRDTTTAVRDSLGALAFRRVAMGASLLPIYTALTDAKGDFRWKDSSAMDHIVTTFLSGETDQNGKPYNAATVRAWIVAAEQEALLPKDQRDRFGSDAHRTFARVRKAKGDRAMLTFVNGLARKNETSVTAVRKAYDAKYPTSVVEESPASAAQRIQTDEIEAATILRDGIAKLGLDPKVLQGLLLTSAMVGQRHADADPEALSIAIAYLATAPKPKATRTRKPKATA